MMEGQNLGAESQSFDRSQPIGDVSKMVGGPVDVVAAVADGGDKVELGSGGGGGKRKRGRPPKAQAKRPPAKKNKEVEEEEEDVCFICFDGGSLVLCDRRGCPKAYHPACIKRDEAFFQSAAKWNCGWHICSICQKAAHHMCYTCTYSLCKGCIRKADYVCVRGDKGFCTICMKTIMLIENNGRGEDGKVQVDFDDKTSWEYLFKVYWVYLKGKLSLTLDELTQAKNPWKGASMTSSVCSSTGVHSRASDPKSITSATAFGNLEENESKRRKIDEQMNILHKETVNTVKLENDGSPTKVGCKEWATKELLDFIAHMKNGDTSMLSQFAVQALMMEYIKRNNLRDPRKKGQIICDSRLKNLFGKSRVGHIEMLERLEFHFHVKDDSQKSMINSPAVHGDADWNSDNLLMVVKDKKPRNYGKGDERALQNKLDEYAAIDVHNMNLIYLRRNLMENLFVDGENFHGKVVGSIVRIRISGSDQKPDMYRLVQVVGTTKVDVPYKVGNKLADVMLEVLNLDKKETISIDTISDEEFSEEECRRLQQSIRCGLVRHFSVGEIQEKAVALQSLRLNDWMETETLRLSHLCDLASEKGHKKSYRECLEKLQLLSTPEERERRLQEIPEVHSDPKMKPEYESDDTEEYFNKEHGEHMESKYSGVSSKNSRAPKKRAESSNGDDGISWKNEQPRNPGITTCPYVGEGATKATESIHMGKDTLGLNLGKSQYEIDCHGSTITNLNHETTLSSSLSNSAPDTTASSLSMRNTPSSSDGETDMVWHYHDPNGKVQGPFSLVQLQMWSTTGYFPADMRIWMSREDKSLLLSDVLKEHFHNKVGDRIGGPTVCSADPSSTIAGTPYAPNSVNYEKLPDSHGSSGHAFGQSWSANNNFTMSNESTLFNTSNVSSSTAQRNDVDIKHVSTASKDADADIVDLPEKMSHEDDEKVEYAGDKMQSLPPSDLLIQDSGNPPSWSSASSLVVGGAKLLGTADGWAGGSSTLVKREEWDSGLVSVSSLKPLEVVGDHVATPTSNIEQNIHSSSQPACNELPSWHGVGEMIEFSTLAEESVSDLLAEVDAMESQYGLPSPTSRRNSFVDDLFNGSFDEFSATPDQGTRSDGFSSSGDIQLPCQSVTTTDEHVVGSSQSNNVNAFDLIKTSNGLQQHSFISPEMDGETKSAYAVGIPQRNSENMSFRCPDVERAPQGMIDINRSAKAEADEGEIETKTSDIQPAAPLDLCQNHGVSEMNHGRAGGCTVRQLEPGGTMSRGEHKEEGEYMHSMTTAPKHARPELVDARVPQNHHKVAGINHHKGAGIKLAGSLLFEGEEDGKFIQPEAQALQPPPPPPPPPLTLGLDPFDPCGLGPETMQGKLDHSGRAGQGTNTSRNGSIGWDPNQRKYGGERFNSSSNYSSPRERSYQVEDSGHNRSSRTSWSKHSSFGSGGSSGGASYSRPPSKVQRVCKFYESGRCKKGASCKYLHP